MFLTTRRVSVSTGLVLLLLAFGAGRVAAQNLLVNGGFDNALTFSLNNGYASVGNGTLIAGWTTQIGNANNAGVYIAQANSGASWIPNPQTGPYSVQLDSTSVDALGSVYSSIAQTVTVTAGQTYLLSFWFNTEVKPNLATIIQTSLTGAFTSTNSYTTTAPGSITQASAVWVHVTQTFVATTSGALTITFSDISTSDSNASVDTVSLTAVPEPATCLAGVFALGLVGVRVRSRRLTRDAAALS